MTWNGRKRSGSGIATCTLIVAFGLLAPIGRAAPETRQASLTAQDDLWKRGLELVTKGAFDEAATTVNQLSGGGKLSDNLRTWIDEYQRKQTLRRELDRADQEKYVKYAQARAARKEYAFALDKAWLAFDVAENQDEFLKSEWLQQLVNDSLEKAEQSKTENEWRDAWDIYWRLGALYEREPRYQKLEREALTHLRLDSMFEDGHSWKDRIDQVRWEDAETALECVELYYYSLQPDHFKKIALAGLEQILMLADSKSGQKVLDGLKDPYARNDFRSRVQARLDILRDDPTVERADVVAQFRRVLDINDQTVRLPRELLVSELMRGAFDPLDDFTTIIWPQETDEFDKHTRGDFIGVGISIVKNRLSDEIEVVTPLEDTPAFRAGVMSGDIILRVDGKPLKGSSINKVVDLIMGPKDSPVTLTIRRKDKEIEFPLMRDKIKIQSVKGVERKSEAPEQWNYWLDEPNGIAYMRVTNFQGNTVEDMTNVLSQLGAKNLRGLVLDLRNNPGGLLDSAWRMASLFLKKDDRVVSTKGRVKSENQELRAMGDGPFVDTPLVLLTDESSASASEIVAGAIRDNHRGAVIGGRTFGKFSVQNLISLGRSNAKLKLTTADYYLPSGVSLHRRPTATEWGVAPNVPVRLVRKEKINLIQGWRSKERIGSAPPSETDDDLNLNDDGDVMYDFVGAIELPRALSPEASPPYAVKYSALPPLSQPDSNDRAKDDPQLDTALLVLRASLLANMHPTLATAADIEKSKDTAQP